MQAFADTLGYLGYMVAVLFVLCGDFGAWTVVAVAGLFLLVWFAFAYSFGGDGDGGE